MLYTSSTICQRMREQAKQRIILVDWKAIKILRFLFMVIPYMWPDIRGTSLVENGLWQLQPPSQ